MQRKLITPEEIQRVRDNSHLTMHELAGLLDCTYDRIKNIKTKNGIYATIPNNVEYRRRYLDWLKIEGDVIVTTDWHIPWHDIDLCNKALAVANKFKIRQLIIGGDLLDLSPLSPFMKDDLQDTLESELCEAERIMSALWESFDNIWMIMGNHEKRLNRLLNSQLTPKRLKKMFEDSNKFVISDFSYCVVNNKWRITHPKSYRQTRGSVANRLALLHKQNIIMAHGHQVNISSDDSATYIIIDSGGMFDRVKVAYSMLDDTTYPNWQNGFVMIKNNAHYMFSDKLGTDWGYWLG